MWRTRSALAAAVVLLVTVGGLFAFDVFGGHSTSSACRELFEIADGVNSGRISNLESARRVAKLASNESDDAVRAAAADARANADAYLSHQNDRPESVSKDLALSIGHLRDVCLAVASRTSGTASAGIGPASAQSGDPCLVGTWRAQQTTTQVGITSPLVGGADTVQTVSGDGRVVVDYAQSAEWRGSVDGNDTSIVKRGIERHQVVGSLGQYHAFGGHVSELFVTQSFAIGQPLVIQAVWYDSTRAYTCDATTLTIENPGVDPDVYHRES